MIGSVLQVFCIRTSGAVQYIKHPWEHTQHLRVLENEKGNAKIRAVRDRAVLEGQCSGTCPEPQARSTVSVASTVPGCPVLYLQVVQVEVPFLPLKDK